MYNFGLNDDQQALKSSLRRFVDGECDRDAVRAVVATEGGFAAAQWRGLGELGVFGLAAPEAYDGSGQGCFDLVVVMETLGRSALPAPVVETLVVADLIARMGDDAQKARLLPRIVSGEMVSTFAMDEPGGGWDADAVQATAEETTAGLRLSGTKQPVPYAHVADLIVCAVRRPGTRGEEGMSLVAIERARLAHPPRLLDTIDDSYRLCEVSLDGVEIEATDVIGAPGAGWAAWRDSARLAMLLGAADQLGCMERGLELLVDYAKVRTQFGKLIGSFQAMKHRCADLLIELEGARGSVYYAADALQRGGDDVAVAVSSAKAYAADASVRSAEKALQSFGAIGFTWEHDIHFYLKRAKRLELTLGDAAFHRELIAQHL